MRFGYFDDRSREYVITQPDTPLPWINYLGSEEFFSLISNTAGGYCFYRDARYRRLTRYRYNNVPLDFSGRYLYLRNNADGDFWSPTWQPVRKDLEDYSCRHGMGYSIIRSTYRQIQTEIRYFVPLGENLEVWDMSLTNLGDEDFDLSVFSLLEFNLWDADDDATNFQRNFNVGEVEVEGSVIYHKTEYRERRNHFAYFACSEPLAGYDTQRQDFLGPYRSWRDSQVVSTGTSCNSIASGWAPIGSHHVRLGLKPGQNRRVVFLLGYAENPAEEKFDPPGSQVINKRRVKAAIDRYLETDTVDDAFQALRAYWDARLGIVQVDTPDEHTNRMVNIWNAYQCMVTFNLSRSASYFESGIGRGMGFRDSSQDLLGFLHMIPERCRERILDLAATQLETGGAYHQYQPLTKRGNDAIGSNFNDDPLWLVLAVCAYIKETGDFEVLEELVPFENRPGSEATLYEHLLRSLQYTLDRLGPHELPLIGRADWNDCLNLTVFSENPDVSFQTAPEREKVTAESLFIAGLFINAAKEMAGLKEAWHDQPEGVPDFEQLAAKMENSIRRHGWDGDWFLRAYDGLGNPLGSQANEEGQIFIEPQGMCVMAGVGLEDGTARRALDSVKKRLATKHGIVLHQPAFTRYYLHLGEISSYPPGYKENAGIFCHTNPWIMISEARMGNGDQAFDYYTRINPSAREAISEIHRCEPYVYAQMIAGRDAPRVGEAKNSWLSGTAAWNYVAITQWILGIRPDFRGLRISPVIPSEWTGFSARRIYRGVTYNIDVKRTGSGNSVSLKVNGVPLEDEIIPVPSEGVKECAVEVRIS